MLARTALVVFCLVFFHADASVGQNQRYGAAALSLDSQAADKLVELDAGTVRLVYGWDIIEPN